MSASLCSCSLTGTSNWVILGLNLSLCSQQKALGVLAMWSWRWSKAFRSVHLCALQILQVLQPLSTKELSLTHMLHHWNKAGDLCVRDNPNERHSGQPMIEPYWEPRGMSDRGCDPSRTEVDALLTPCHTQGKMLMNAPWPTEEIQTELMTRHLCGHQQAYRQLVKSHSRPTRCYSKRSEASAQGKCLAKTKGSKTQNLQSGIPGVQVPCEMLGSCLWGMTLTCCLKESPF